MFRHCHLSPTGASTSCRTFLLKQTAVVGCGFEGRLLVTGICVCSRVVGEQGCLVNGASAEAHGFSLLGSYLSSNFGVSFPRCVPADWRLRSKLMAVPRPLCKTDVAFVPHSSHAKDQREWFTTFSAGYVLSTRMLQTIVIYGWAMVFRSLCHHRAKLGRRLPCRRFPSGWLGEVLPWACIDGYRHRARALFQFHGAR